MGVVYQARDHRRGIDVALKTLRRLDPGAIFRFKNEFRALADVSHPNLISLYELVAPDGEQWFFTMELIDGVDWVSWVRDEDLHGPRTETRTSVELARLPERPEHTSDTRVATGSTTNPEQPWVDVQEERPHTPIDWDRLRDALGQLARGVAALHASGHLHRDIKPSNVMVTSAGRVVLLDFGVIAELNRQVVSAAGTVEVVGTPAYMAPEQFRGEAVPASDWYSVGVMLYDALTGRRPFARSEANAMVAPNAEPPPPRLQRPDVPDDLDRLCSDLLRLHPEKRPTDAEVLERLGVSELLTPTPSPSRGDDSMLVGRERQLRELHGAYQEVREGAGVAVYVEGTSGMGKTSLVRRFLEEIQLYDPVVVLEGRCYERESVPYKAIDSLVDALVRYLVELRDRDVEALLPTGVRTLARVFPVLRRVEAVAQAPPVTASVPDPVELRRRAFDALRELLARLARRGPLVLFIDDLQWGDADSAPLLEMLTRADEMPPLLMLASFRREDAERSELLRELLRPDNDATRLAVDALTSSEAERLAERLLPDTPERTALANTVAAESGGNPYFIQELVRYVATETGPRDTAPTLSRVIRARVARLPGAAQRLVEVIAVAGKPVSQRVAQDAAELDMAARLDFVQLLRSAQLVRSTGLRDTDVVECYHDRIRETVMGALGEDELRAHHKRLALAIQAFDDSDAEALATHFRAAGDDAAAAAYVVEAARQAANALAFDRAAELYDLALDLRADDSNRVELMKRLGDALVNAGRGADAAQTYLHASELADASESLELRRRAGEQFLRAGYVDQGTAVLRAVLAEVGLKFPASPMRAVPALLWGRLRLRLRGLGFRERDESQIPKADLRRADLLFGVTLGMAMVDPATAGAFGVKQSLLSLKMGEPYRVARTLAVHAGFLSTEGVRAVRRTAELLDRARELAHRTNQPYAIALVEGMRAMAESQQGRLSEAIESSRRAEQVFRSECTGVAWELHTMDLTALSSLLYRGDYAEMARQTPPIVERAQRSGDMFAATNLRSLLLPAVHLANDRPDEARRSLDEAVRHLEHGFYFHHVCAVLMNAQTDLYVAEPRAAWERLLSRQAEIKRSLLMFVQLIRGNWLAIKGMAAVGAAAEGREDARRLRRIALREARKLQRERVLWCSSHAWTIRAAVAAQRGRLERAVALLDRAAGECDRAETHLRAAICRRRKGELIGGDVGRQLVAESNQFAFDHGVRNPDAVANIFAPGFSPPKQLSPP